jgi:hypothetical protein
MPEPWIRRQKCADPDRAGHGFDPFFGLADHEMLSQQKFSSTHTSGMD